MKEEDRDPSHGPFSSCKPKSTIMPPPSNDEILDIFLFMVTDSLEKLYSSDKLKQLSTYNRNMTGDNFLALKNLEQDPTIVIKPADKGSNLVIIDHRQYHNMCMSILSDKRGYNILERDPMESYQLELSNILQSGRDQLIDSKEHDFLFPLHPRVATFY